MIELKPCISRIILYPAAHSAAASMPGRLTGVRACSAPRRPARILRSSASSSHMLSSMVLHAEWTITANAHGVSLLMDGVGAITDSELNSKEGLARPASDASSAARYTSNASYRQPRKTKSPPIRVPARLMAASFGVISVFSSARSRLHGGGSTS
jgi:hypothetical protein